MNFESAQFSPSEGATWVPGTPSPLATPLY